MFPVFAALVVLAGASALIAAAVHQRGGYPQSSPAVDSYRQAAQLVVRWERAQNAGDTVGYGALYAEHFSGIKLNGSHRVAFSSRDAWLQDSSAALRRGVHVSVHRISYHEMPDGDVEVRFMQRFRVGLFGDQGTKHLRLVRTPAGLRIGAEEMETSRLVGPLAWTAPATSRSIQLRWDASRSAEELRVPRLEVYVGGRRQFTRALGDGVDCLVTRGDHARARTLSTLTCIGGVGMVEYRVVLLAGCVVVKRRTFGQSDNLPAFSVAFSIDVPVEAAVAMRREVVSPPPTPRRQPSPPGAVAAGEAPCLPSSTRGKPTVSSEQPPQSPAGVLAEHARNVAGVAGIGLQVLRANDPHETLRIIQSNKTKSAVQRLDRSSDQLFGLDR